MSEFWLTAAVARAVASALVVYELASG